MSRKKKNSGMCCANRCTNCGGRMRLVNVTLIDRFQSPEASQYDLSVSRRKAMFASTQQASTQELMCNCCGQRVSIVGAPIKMKKKKSGKAKKSGFARFIGFLIFVAIIAVGVYFAYEYKEDIIKFWKPFENVFNTIDDAVEYVKNFFNDAVEYVKNLFKK